MKHLRTIIVFLVVILAGCKVQVDDQKIVLWTDSIELLAYTQVFNSSQDRYKVEVTNKNTGRWDIAVGQKLNLGENAKLFVPLDGLFWGSSVDRGAFYQDVLAKGIRNRHQILLPLSFDVDAFFFVNGKVKSDLSMDDFIKNCQDFNAIETRYRKCAFSPLWNPDSERFFPGRIADMINGICGGAAEERTFREKYLHNYYVELLETGRILFWHSNVGSFYTLPDARRKGLDFRYLLDGNGRVEVSDDILWVGIPQKSANVKGARVFIKWIMNPDVQQNLILKANNMDIHSFGLAGGFSAVKKVNVETLPKLYPFITSHIPVDGFLKFVD